LYGIVDQLPVTFAWPQADEVASIKTGISKEQTDVLHTDRRIANLSST
jgi:hypothetical protein